MKALQYRSFGGHEVLEWGEIAEPVAASGRVLVERRRAGAPISRIAQGDRQGLTGPLMRPGYAGAVARSRSASQIMAASREAPHISADGCKPPQNAGRSGRPNTLQRLS